MHYWRLLLFALLAVFQPIASFTERNLVDGREQCCSRDSLLRDSRLSYETRINKPNEDRRLSREIRGDLRYEVRRDTFGLTRASADRRLVEFRSEREVRRFSSEPLTRSTRAESRREYGTESRRERVSTLRDDRARRISHRENNRDMRERELTRRTFSREDVRQQDREARELFRARQSRDSRFSRDMQSERRFNPSMESQRETNRNRDYTAERALRTSREKRNILQRTRTNVANPEQSRAREERRVVRERMGERRTRSESRLLQISRDERALNRRVRETVSERRERSLNDVRNERLESRFVHDQREVRDERGVSSRRDIEARSEKRRLQRDEFRPSRDVSIRRETRQRSSERRQDLRESDRARVDLRSVRSERADTRRDSILDESRVNNDNRIDRRVRDVQARIEVTERREHRSADRVEIRDSRRDVRLIRSRSLDSQQRSDSNNREEYRLVKHMERDNRFRSNPEFLRSRQNSYSIREKKTVEKSTAMNWQYMFYTLQGIYLCGILMQMLSQKECGKKPRVLAWFSAPQSLIKVD